MRILVLGATGYIGGRLVPLLVQDGHDVRCLARDPDKLDGRDWRPEVEVIEGDLLDPESLTAAFSQADRVYYLVHSLGTGDDFDETERRCAENARRAAEEAGIERIIYLGGLGEDADDLSAHLRSRHDVGEELARGPVPVVEMRAAVILGSGSASFEMLRGLVEVLPVMITPKWVNSTLCQPASVSDVLEALRQLATTDVDPGVWEIGGPDVLTYAGLMQSYASAAGLMRRVILPVPLVTPGLSTHWVDLVTSLPGGIARELVLGLQNDVVVTGRDISVELGIDPLGAEESISAALGAIQDLDIPTRWASVPRSQDAARPRPFDPGWSGGTVLLDEKSAVVRSSKDQARSVAMSLGGETGWLAFDWMWRIRGFGDDLVGGVGYRRGRRHPSDLVVGDMVDFFIVDQLEPNLLRLRAEMRMPGHGWLEWEFEELDPKTTKIHQRARFVPSGLLGRLYWWALVPFHALVFRGMLAELAKRSEAKAGQLAGAGVDG